jgi:hypothetical protein
MAGARLQRLIALAATASLAAWSSGASAHIVSTSGLTVVSPPSFVGSNFIIGLGLPAQLIFDEQQNVTLAAPLAFDVGGVAPAGTKVDSAFFATNSCCATLADTTATFSGKVLGVIFYDGSAGFAASDYLGAPGTTYQESPAFCGSCGFEAGDTAGFSGDTVMFHTFYSEPGDFARVITAAATVPEPRTWAMMLLGVGAIGALARRRRLAAA